MSKSGYINREIEGRLTSLAQQFPVVFITGPRQAGKSTLARHAFPSYQYVSMEDYDLNEYVERDPRGFLQQYDHHVIIDEAQKAPILFNYLQAHIDEQNEPGMYILSGSQNFLLMKNITQSLAGRVAILDLYPLSYYELNEAHKAPHTLYELLQQGGYPRLYTQVKDTATYYDSYVRTYLERDIQSEIAQGRLDDFRRFMRLCAGRIGCILDINALATDASIRPETAKKWLSLLTASNITLTVAPYYKNFNKRMVKRPKLYMTDTGLASYLLGIKSMDELKLSFFRGPIFENYVLMEYMKRAGIRGPFRDIWFWHETQTNEVDFVIGQESKLSAIEVKSSATPDIQWFKRMKLFCNLADVDEGSRYAVYAGDTHLNTSNGAIVPWCEWPPEALL